MPRATTVESVLVERQQPKAEMAAIHFPWSVAKLRIAGLALFGSAVPSAFGCAASAPWLQGLCLLWLVTVAWLLHALQRRVFSKAVVLSIDRRGICDRRLMSRPISWQEIEAICRVNIDRSQVVDIKLRWPEVTLRDTRLAVRIGVYCQQGYGVPAVTISMLLLDGTVCGLLEAIAQYRPDRLHVANRGRLRHAFQPKA
jgi:hypothetical protein